MYEGQILSATSNVSFWDTSLAVS